MKIFTLQCKQDLVVLEKVSYKDETRLWPDGDLEFEPITNCGNLAIVSDKITKEATTILGIIALYFMYTATQNANVGSRNLKSKSTKNGKSPKPRSRCGQ